MQVEEISDRDLDDLVNQYRSVPKGCYSKDKSSVQGREEFLIDHQFEIYPSLERYNEFFGSHQRLQLGPNANLKNIDLLTDMASSTHIIDFKGLKLSPKTIVRQEKIQDRFRFWPRKGIHRDNQAPLIRHLQIGYMLSLARSLSGKKQKKESPLCAALLRKHAEAKALAAAKPVDDLDDLFKTF